MECAQRLERDESYQGRKAIVSHVPVRHDHDDARQQDPASEEAHMYYHEYAGGQGVFERNLQRLC